MLTFYIILGLTTLLALAGVFAPHGSMGGSICEPERVDDDVIYLEEVEDLADTEDTQPFIWLPFHVVKPVADMADGYEDDEEDTKRFISSFPPPLPTRVPVFTNDVVIWP